MYNYECNDLLTTNIFQVTTRLITAYQLEISGTVGKGLAR